MRERRFVVTDAVFRMVLLFVMKGHAIFAGISLNPSCRALGSLKDNSKREINVLVHGLDAVKSNMLALRLRVRLEFLVVEHRVRSIRHSNGTSSKSERIQGG